MNSQLASSLFLAFGELIALARDFLAHRRQEQAEALQPGADAIKTRIDDLVRHALELEASLPKPSVYPAPPEPEHSLHDVAQALKAHIDALVSSAHSSVVPISTAAEVPQPTPESPVPRSAPAGQPDTSGGGSHPAASG